MLDAGKLDQILFGVLVAGRLDAEFVESDHPRAADGKFGSGGSSKKSSKPKKPSKAEKHALSNYDFVKSYMARSTEKGAQADKERAKLKEIDAAWIKYDETGDAAGLFDLKPMNASNGGAHINDVLGNLQGVARERGAADATPSTLESKKGRKSVSDEAVASISLSAAEYGKMTTGQKAAFYKWRSEEGFEAINGYLASNGERFKSAATAARTLDKFIAGKTSSEPMTLYRGASLTRDQAVGMAPGATVKLSRGLVATTFDEKGAYDYVNGYNMSGAGDVPTLFTIDAPAGTHALNVLSGSDDHADADEADEILLGSDQEFEVVSSEERDGVLHVSVKIMQARKDSLDAAKLDSVLYELMQAAGTSALPESVPPSTPYEPTVDVAPVRAAGAMIATGVGPDDHVLLLQRARDCDHALEWCFPGGKVEDGETALEAARREVLEETGIELGRASEWTRQVSEGVDFTTFLSVVAEEPGVAIEAEHVAFCWALLSAPPLPLHPGCAVALARHGMDELAVAEAIRDGRLVSPQRFGNFWLYAIRITGTGMAYRVGLDEFCWRSPSDYLDERFVRRCAGLPVLWDHTDGPKLDSEEYRERNVGSVFFAYVRGDEVWAVARVYDDLCLKWLVAGDRSTSPGVVFASVNDNRTFERDDGATLLVEGVPQLLDHIALCDAGVWDKGGAPAGVDSVKEDTHAD